jgi:hypothetical protein
MNDNPALKDMVERLERETDAGMQEEDVTDSDSSESVTSDAFPLSAEIEQFLRDISKSDNDENSDGQEQR